MTRRIVRQTLVASLLAFHTAIALCGPCLHELPGMGHDSSDGSQSRQDPLRSHDDSGDNCAICHFLVQGQLPVASFSAIPAAHFGYWLGTLTSPVKAIPAYRQSRQRAPPVLQP